MRLIKSDLDSLHLEVTTRCRIACPKCGRAYARFKQFINKDMDLEVHNSVVVSKKYDYILYCGNFGDPIYHPNFLEMIKFTKQNNIPIHIETNGSGKTNEWWIELFKMLGKRDRINFNIDGFDNTVGTYRVNFKNKDFEQLVELMKIAKNDYQIEAVWQFIPFNFNEHQIFDAASFAINNGISFFIRKSFRWSDQDDPLLPTNKNLSIFRSI